MAQYLSILIAGIKITDVIDVAVISFAIYMLLGFVKSTRASQLAKGLGILLGVYVVSGAAHLYTVNFVLAKVLDIGIIALVIIFQPELRRALEYMGRRSINVRQLVTGQETTSSTASADEITKAIEHFASIKEGALIVIERETALSEYTSGATIIDALISDELLKNIFYLGSPLHDGAVIVRGDRVHAAGCVLPLTENPNLSKDLGTRHRAAIGISEVSDAIVLVVSEETGIISMAQDGKLQRFLDPKAVEKTLLAHYMSKANNAKSDSIVNVIMGRVMNGKR